MQATEKSYTKLIETQQKQLRELEHIKQNDGIDDKVFQEDTFRQEFDKLRQQIQELEKENKSRNRWMETQQKQLRELEQNDQNNDNMMMRQNNNFQQLEETLKHSINSIRCEISKQEENHDIQLKLLKDKMNEIQHELILKNKLYSDQVLHTQGLEKHIKYQQNCIKHFKFQLKRHETCQHCSLTKGTNKFVKRITGEEMDTLFCSHDFVLNENGESMAETTLTKEGNHEKQCEDVGGLDNLGFSRTDISNENAADEVHIPADQTKECGDVGELDNLDFSCTDISNKNHADEVHISPAQAQDRQPSKEDVTLGEQSQESETNEGANAETQSNVEMNKETETHDLLFTQKYSRDDVGGFLKEPPPNSKRFLTQGKPLLS